MSFVTAEELIANDKQLANNADFAALHEKYGEPRHVSRRIKNAKAGLEAKNHAVSVVNTSAEALALIKSLIPEGSEVHNTASQTLAQIGFVDVLKTGNKGKWKNMHGAALAESGGDMAKLIPLLRTAASSEYVVSTVDAVTDDGDFIVADGSSTRVAAYVGAPHVIAVVGENKLVKTLDQAKERLHSYVYALESARVRKAYGWPAAMLSNELVVTTNSATPNRIHFIIVKEALGF